MGILQSLNVSMFLQYFFLLCICFCLFSLLAQVFPNIRKQPLFRKGISVDLVYWFLPPLLYSHVVGWILVGISLLFFVDVIESRQFTSHGFGFFAELPFLLQFFVSLLLINILEYWSHRLFHNKYLWKIHAIHHAPKELDWLSGVRIHPINMFFHSLLGGIVVYVLGFSPIVYLVRFPFDILYAAMVHANLNWTFGPLRYVFASPVFHRFHHTSIQDGGEKNFAPTLSFIDLLFGTFYMPKGELPKSFGVDEEVPETFMGQLRYPFTKKSATPQQVDWI